MLEKLFVLGEDDDTTAPVAADDTLDAIEADDVDEDEEDEDEEDVI